MTPAGTVVVCSTCGAVMPAGVGGPIAALLWHQAAAHGRRPGVLAQ